MISSCFRSSAYHLLYDRVLLETEGFVEVNKNPANEFWVSRFRLDYRDVEDLPVYLFEQIGKGRWQARLLSRTLREYKESR